MSSICKQDIKSCCRYICICFCSTIQISSKLSVSGFTSGAYEATKLDAIDPDDNKFLAAVFETKADYLISLDNHLLSIKYYHGTQILTPRLFLEAIGIANY
ncbi:hypothetical protein VB774_15160 [Pseudanabaena galeata UHCC 0370]|jgi:predicted nucleic acid-binding protein|uniref:PIN domain-containing protein n=1 Tax=Pseudanabaena galeata UHCC 0370 TaxID=3110310 RepID=A0ABU5TN31_9CYAN|nr:hypothetical protein [Pseudanabaena galeata]MEA5478963.1 hypothetical protein [Pseudanabaena galeata UHCC 0370]MEA5485831.1 hypothetical protein [Pseudanabaena sp. CCNP1317]WGS72278.1 hypothetical protein OA858_21625 [Pseudanabaena galeata CCNP1313]